MQSDSQSHPTTPQQPLAAESTPTNVLLEMLRELRGQRDAFRESERLASNERKAERRWRIAFQFMVFGMPVLFGVIYLVFFLSTTGFKFGPFGNVVGVVRIEGAIGANDRWRRPSRTRRSRRWSCRSTVLGARPWSRSGSTRRSRR